MCAQTPMQRNQQANLPHKTLIELSLGEHGIPDVRMGYEGNPRGPLLPTPLLVAQREEVPALCMRKDRLKRGQDKSLRERANGKAQQAKTGRDTAR